MVVCSVLFVSEGRGFGEASGDDAAPSHDLLSAVDAVAADLEWVREAAGRAWSLSEAELRDSVVQMARLRSRVEAAYLAVVKVLDGRPEAVPGAPLDRAGSTFLQQRLHLDPGRANADVRAAHTLDPDDGTLPEVGAALAAGDITRDHADVCVRAAARLPKRLLTTVVEDAVTGRPVTGMQAVDRWLAGQARQHQVRSITQLTEQLVALLDPDRKERFDEDAHLRRSIRLGIDATGMGLLSVTLTPADAATLKATLAAMAKPVPATEAIAVDADGNEQTTLVRDERTLVQRTYDAFMRLVRGEGGTAPVGLLVTATLEQVAAAGAVSKDRDTPTHAGETLTRSSNNNSSGNSSSKSPPGPGCGMARLHRHGSIGFYLLGYLSCTATLTRVLLDANGAPLDVGRAHRLATPAQRKAIAVRDGGCIVPNCACPPDGADVHHVIAWSAGGATDLANLVMLCPRHHQMVHMGILDVKIEAGRAWVRLPEWMDPARPWVRNLIHQSHEAAEKLGQQLRLALDLEAEARGDRRVTPIDLRPWWDRVSEAGEGDGGGGARSA